MRRFLSVFLLLLGLSGYSRTEEASETTVIQSDHLEVIGGETGNRFIFSGSVRIDGMDFVATCERLEVRTTSEPTEEGDDTGFGAIDLVEATGSVRIRQDTREATAGKALIYPAEDRVVLEDDPVVRDAKGTVRGYRMILFGKTQKITVEPGPGGQRPTVELPSLRTTDPPPAE